MRTKYASAEKAGKNQLMKEFLFLKNIDYIENLMNSLPFLGAILNKQRQVVYANEKLLDVLNIETIEEILGQRPGNALRCVNADKDTGGCGTSENYTVCGAVNCILESQRSMKKVVKECRITAQSDDEIVAYDFLVTTVPFHWQNKQFFIFSLVDISSEKRRQAMERIFFHDVINITGSMYGLIDLLKKETDITRIQEFADLLDSINRDLTNEILSQRDLTAAENGELMITREAIQSLDFIHDSTDQMQQHEIARNKMIVQDNVAEEFEIKSDSTLLKRILMNMLKNALEATNEGGIVTIGCNKKKSIVRFWVHNGGFIPREDQLQIFQRSFSTKGLNRGLGTYSMKLLGEQYLKGKVGFTSNEKEGTMFFLELPVTS